MFIFPVSFPNWLDISLNLECPGFQKEGEIYSPAPQSYVRNADNFRETPAQEEI